MVSVKIIIWIIVAVVLVVGGVVGYMMISKAIAGFSLFPKPKKLGEPCNVGPDCEGWTAALQPGNDCCAGKCSGRVKDYDNRWYCAEESPLLGDLPVGSMCIKTEQCAGNSIDLQPGTKCCNSVCQEKVLDYTGMRYYCPGEAILGNLPVGSPCISTEQCAGNSIDLQLGTKCCGGICTEKKRDHAGAYYCPAECRGTSILDAPGTCA